VSEVAPGIEVSTELEKTVPLIGNRPCAAAYGAEGSIASYSASNGERIGVENDVSEDGHGNGALFVEPAEFVTITEKVALLSADIRE